jgi:hypothetical protein
MAVVCYSPQTNADQPALAQAACRLLAHPLVRSNCRPDSFVVSIVQYLEQTGADLARQNSNFLKRWTAEFKI